jgi:ABC-type branched-subunit amino acid transport system ATPase component
MIQLLNLEKSYPVGAGRYWVLRRIDLEIKEGEFVTIMGPSGAGKSTLLAIMGILDGEFSGEYVFLGQPVHKLNLKKRAELGKRHIGFVFQQYHLLDSPTGARYRQAGGWLAREIRPDISRRRPSWNRDPKPNFSRTQNRAARRRSSSSKAFARCS